MLAGLPLDTTVPTLKMPGGTDDPAIDAPSVPPADHPALAALEAEVARADEAVRLAELERSPDIDVEAQYGYRRMQRDMASLPISHSVSFTRRTSCWTVRSNGWSATLFAKGAFAKR